jgi:UDP-GlcNAc3NAcA epimerase
VEAGLRSFNRAMPEEINRVITDHLSHLCFAPTDVAIENLRREGIDDDRVALTGDVMYDAVRMFAPRAPALEVVAPDLASIAGAPFVVATVHRAENTDDPHRLAEIARALEATASSIPVVFPVHPRTRAALDRHGIAFDRVHTIAPVGYLEMLGLERDAALVVTDSGGVQKEAFFQRTPCVTVRTETEWVELVELGWNQLADPTDSSHMAKAIHRSLDQRGAEAEPYGDGRSAEHIVSLILGS